MTLIKHNFKQKIVFSPKLALALILVTFITISSTYSILVPTFEGPDEDLHYRYSIWIFNEELRPDLIQPAYNNVSVPLYYIVNSIFFNLLQPNDEYASGLHVTYDYPHEDKNRFQHGLEEVFPFSDIAATIHTLRLLSIAFGVITLIFVYKTAQLVFPTDRWLPLYTTAFVSLIPTFLYVNSILNSDVLVWTLSTITFFFLFKFVNEPKRNKFVILTAIFATLAISTKANGLILIPIFLIAIGYLFISKQISLQNVITKLSLYGIFSIISISWLWVLRVKSNIDYTSSSLSEIVLAAFGFFQYNLVDSELVPTTGIGGIPGLIDSTEITVINFGRLIDISFLHNRFIEFALGGFWWNTIWPPQIYFYIADIFLIFSIAGLILLIKKRNTMPELYLKKNHFVIIFSSIILTLGYMYINFFTVDLGIARYYFPIIVMLGMIISLGLYVFGYDKKRLKFLILTPLVFLIILNIQLLVVMENEHNLPKILDKDFDGISDDLDANLNQFSNEFNDFSYDRNNFGIIHREIEFPLPEKYEEYLLSLPTIEEKVYNIIRFAPGLADYKIAETSESYVNDISEVFEILQKLFDERKIYQAGIGYNIVHQKLEVSSDNENSAIKITAPIQKVPKSIEVNICGETNIWLLMGDEVIFSCDNNGANIIKHSIFLKLPDEIKEGDLIQGENLSEVYLIEYKTKRHIATIEAFESHGYTLDMIKYVPDEIVNEIFEGYPISD